EAASGASPQALAVARRRRDAAVVRVCRFRRGDPARARAARALGAGGARRVPRRVLRHRRLVAPAGRAGGDQPCADGLRAGEGGLRAALRARQPAGLGTDPRRGYSAADRGRSSSMIDLGANPHDVLGAHEADGGVVVRTYRPEAEAVRVQPAGVAAELKDPAGLWEALLPGAELPLEYELEVEYAGGATFTMRDPYSFLPTLGDLDQHLV